MNIRSILSLTAAVAALSAPSFAIDIVAHRGASHAAPENTVSAIKLTWLENADGTEVDVYFTRDKKVMICHDGTTGRTSDYNLEIQKSTFAQLRCLDFGSWKDPKYKGE
ncbi:MAG: glycerophosphodiester phosphodiesterase, partial [Abditibacteriota bacterium]|nr:glycerophosphodiester phosphodiesterase [Abditibacteriota bacterium]